MTLFDELLLPNGAVIPNRIAKAAMEENMADDDHGPSDKLLRLYQAWADGGAGLLITVNVMIEPRAMTGPGGVILEDGQQLARFKKWARIGKSRGAAFWLQINHSGNIYQRGITLRRVAFEWVTPGSYRVFFRDMEIGELNAEELRFRAVRRVV